MRTKLGQRDLWLRAAWASLVLGAACGVLFSPLLVWAVSLMSATMPDGAVVLVTGMVMALFLPSFVAARLTAQPSMALVAQLGQGAALAWLTPYPWDAALACVLIGGMVAGAVWLVRRRAALADAHLMVAAVGGGAVVFGLNVVGHGFALGAASTVALLSVMLGGAVAVAWCANWLARWAAHTRWRAWLAGGGGSG